MNPGTRSRSRPDEPHTAKSRPPPKILLGIAMVACLLLAAAPSAAGPLEDAVDRIENKVNKVVNNTNGMQDLVGNVKGITADFEPGAFDDLRDALGEAQDLLAFVKAQRDGAGSSSDHPDLAALMAAIADMIGVLLDDPDIEFGLVTQLLGVLPDPVVAVAGQAVSKAGIDGERIIEIQQAASDLALVRDALLQFDADQDLVSSNRSLPGAEAAMLPNVTVCDGINASRVVLRPAEAVLRGVGLILIIAGEIVSAQADLWASSTGGGIHGYVRLDVETDTRGTVGKILVVVGKAVLQTVNAVSSVLRHCELIWHQESLLAKQDEILIELGLTTGGGGGGNVQ